MSSAESLLWSVETAARSLGIGQSTLRRMIRTGDVPATRCGRRVLLSPDALRSRFGHPAVESPAGGSSPTNNRGAN